MPLAIMGSLLLDHPFASRRPRLRVRLIIPVPVVGGLGRVKIVTALYQRNMPIAKKDVITCSMQRRGLLLERIIRVHMDSTRQAPNNSFTADGHIPESWNPQRCTFRSVPILRVQELQNAAGPPVRASETLPGQRFRNRYKSSCHEKPPAF